MFINEGAVDLVSYIRSKYEQKETCHTSSVVGEESLPDEQLYFVSHIC